ncbi:hypothetical protein BB347_17025 (plasmid) [Natronorubrum daqingense]|uniref:Uncharacterized protein n=1 Tax=Natronorubrum daqingense TaxID=588898 RepID=A0A1P8RIG6_9EURY|nr:hypothetical protein BB347_17025 [Natronorubrum daqingense]
MSAVDVQRSRSARECSVRFRPSPARQSTPVRTWHSSSRLLIVSEVTTTDGNEAVGVISAPIWRRLEYRFGVTICYYLD